MIGYKKVWLPQSRIKATADRAGHFPQWAQWNRTGTFSERDVTFCSQNNNWSTVQVLLKTTAAKAVYLHRHSSISDTQAGFKPQQPTHTQGWTANATTDRRWQLGT